MDFSYQVKQRVLILIQRFVATEPIENENLQLLGASAIHLCSKVIILFYFFNLNLIPTETSKFEDHRGLTFERLTLLCDHQYGPLDFHNMQIRILSMNGFNISFPIPGDYIRVLLNAAVLAVNRIIFKDIDELITYSLTSNLN